MPQILRLASGIVKLTEAYQARRLGFQRGHHDCFYDYGDGSVCAIGAMLEPETIAEIQVEQVNDDTLESLIDNDIVQVSDDEEEDLRELQEVHDEACGNAIWETKFVATLNAIREKYGLSPIEQLPQENS